MKMFKILSVPIYNKLNEYIKCPFNRNYFINNHNLINNINQNYIQTNLYNKLKNNKQYYINYLKLIK